MSAEAEFTRKNALEILKSNGYRWKMAETFVAEADAKNMLAESAFRPHVGLQLRQVYAKFNPIQFGGADNIDVERVGFGTTGFVADWTLMDPIASAKKAIASSDLQASKEKLKQNQTDMIALTLFQFLNIQRLQQQVSVMNTNLEKSQVILKLAKTKKNVGAGIPLDVSKANSLYSLDRLKKLNAINRLLKSRHELSESLGIDTIEPNFEPLVAHKIPMEKLKQALEISLSGRSDIRSADTSLDETKRILEYSRHKLLPKVALMGELGTTQSTMLGFPLRQATGIIGVTLTLPIDTGGEIAGLRAQALSLERRASLNLQQVRIEALSRVKESLEQLVASEEAMDAADTYLKTAIDEAAIFETRLKQGASNLVDYMNSHGNLSSAQDSVIEAVFNYEAARLACYRAMGSFDHYFEEEGK